MEFLIKVLEEEDLKFIEGLSRAQKASLENAAVMAFHDTLDNLKVYEKREKEDEEIRKKQKKCNHELESVSWDDIGENDALVSSVCEKCGYEEKHIERDYYRCT